VKLLLGDNEIDSITGTSFKTPWSMRNLYLTGLPTQTGPSHFMEKFVMPGDEKPAKMTVTPGLDVTVMEEGSDGCSR